LAVPVESEVGLGGRTFRRGLGFASPATTFTGVSNSYSQPRITSSRPSQPTCVTAKWSALLISILSITFHSRSSFPLPFFHILTHSSICFILSFTEYCCSSCIYDTGVLHDRHDRELQGGRLHSNEHLPRTQRRGTWHCGGSDERLHWEVLDNVHITGYTDSRLACCDGA
jgi:hypothetical protein